MTACHGYVLLTYVGNSIGLEMICELMKLSRDLYGQYIYCTVNVSRV